MERPHDDEVPGAAAHSLTALLETVGAHLLHPLAVSSTEDTWVTEPVLWDPHESLPRQPGGILLAVGRRAPSPDVDDIVTRAGAAGYGAVVVKSLNDAGLDDLAELGHQVGVAILVAPDALQWRHLDGMLTAALAATGTADDTYASVGLGDLFALANVIASTVGGAVTIEDPRGRVLAYSNLPHHDIDEVRKQAILGLQTPERPGNRSEYSRIGRAEGAAHFSDLGPGHTDRLAVAVRAGQQLLGMIFVIDGTPPLPEGAAEKLEEAAHATALHLLRARSNRDPERRNRSEALRALLEGSGGDGVAAAQLPLAMDAETVVVGIAHATVDSDRTHGAYPGMAGARIVDLVKLHCEAWHPDALCTVDQGVVYALVPISWDDTAWDRLRKFGEDVAVTVRGSAQLDVRVGIGTLASRLDQVATSRRGADRVLRALEHGPGDATVATVHDVESRVALLDLLDRGAVAPDLLLVALRRTFRHDRDHGTDYATTLLTYLDHFGDVAPAAAALTVHENTLRYRMRRLQEMFGIPLDDPETRLVAWLQLRLLAFEDAPLA